RALALNPSRTSHMSRIPQSPSIQWRLALYAIGTAYALVGVPHVVAASPPIRLWPQQPPGETIEQLGPEMDTTRPTDNLIAGRRLIRLGNVSEPSIQIFSPPDDSNTGAAVLVCP